MKKNIIGIKAKRIVLLAAFLFTASISFANHIVGGDITVKHLTGNDFEVTLRFYRDCLSSTGFDNPITLGVFDKVTNGQAFTFDMPLVSQQILALGDSCYTPPNLCVEQGIFVKTITLPNNPNGYYISWQRCCRNTVIQNIAVPGDAAMVFYAEVPNPSMGDSSPIFGSYPNAYMCISQPNTQNFSATDIDGDSLFYSLVTPLNGNTTATAPSAPPSPGPYSVINWQTPYSATDIVGGTPVMAINGHTGILTAQPSALGVFVFAVRVEEFRGGIKLGEIRRDVQYQVLNCTTNSPPVFSYPLAHTYTLIAGDTLCTQIEASDPNFDWVSLNASSELFQASPSRPEIEFTYDSAQTIVQSTLCIRTNCESIRDNPYHVTLYARDYSCYGTNIVPFDIDVYVKAPLDGNMDSIIANVFTPNGDGVNDFFKIRSDRVNACFDNFNIKIYNRWGLLVYESSDFHFKWDGHNKKNGSALEEGEYYYLVTGTFKDKQVKHNGVIHLLR